MKKYAVIIYYTLLLHAWWLLQCMAFIQDKTWLAAVLFATIIACFEWSVVSGCKPKRQRNGRFA